MNDKQAVPFGMLFEEPARQTGDQMIPMYDENTSLSYIKDSNGRLVPYVEFAKMSTHTMTQACGESVDSDVL